VAAHVLIAQLSDPHVRPDGELYQGVVDSNAMFVSAIAHVNALDPRPDLVLLSGDLVDKGDPAEYAMLRRLLAALDIPTLVIPGNHDNREAFRAAFGDYRYLPAAGPMNYVAASHGPVRIIGFDVTLPGLHHGAIDEAGARWLDEALAAEPNRPTVIMMHQPPFESGVPYLDDYLCRDGGRLAEVVARHANVERIVCGHVHRFMQLHALHRAVDDDGDCPAAETGRAACVPRRTAGHAAAPLAARRRPGYALRSDRHFPGALPVRVIFSDHAATLGTVRHYRAACALSKSSIVPGTNMPNLSPWANIG
jgi:Icc protein